MHLPLSMNNSDKTSVQLCIDNNMEEYKVLHVFEFTSTRKRMTVILQSSQGLLTSNT